MRFLTIIPLLFLTPAIAGTLTARGKSNEFPEASQHKPLSVQFEVKYGDTSVLTFVPIGKEIALEALTPPLVGTGATKLNVNFPAAFFETTRALVRDEDPRLNADLFQASGLNQFEGAFQVIDFRIVINTGEIHLGRPSGPFCCSRVLSFGLPPNSTIVSVSGEFTAEYCAPSNKCTIFTPNGPPTSGEGNTATGSTDGGEGDTPTGSTDGGEGDTLTGSTDGGEEPT